MLLAFLSISGSTIPAQRASENDAERTCSYEDQLAKNVQVIHEKEIANINKDSLLNIQSRRIDTFSKDTAKIKP